VVDNLSSGLGLRFRLQSGGRKSIFMAASVLWTLWPQVLLYGWDTWEPLAGHKSLILCSSSTLPARNDMFSFSFGVWPLFYASSNDLLGRYFAISHVIGLDIFYII